MRTRRTLRCVGHRLLVPAFVNGHLAGGQIPSARAARATDRVPIRQPWMIGPAPLKIGKQSLGCRIEEAKPAPPGRLQRPGAGSPAGTKPAGRLRARRALVWEHEPAPTRRSAPEVGISQPNAGEPGQPSFLFGRLGMFVAASAALMPCPASLLLTGGRGPREGLHSSQCWLSTGTAPPADAAASRRDPDPRCAACYAEFVRAHGQRCARPGVTDDMPSDG